MESRLVPIPRSGIATRFPSGSPPSTAGSPDHSIGMTFAELIALADRLCLVDALNLDGDGSTTTMVVVVGGMVVNRPSDTTSPRPVSDAILVQPRHQ